MFLDSRTFPQNHLRIWALFLGLLFLLVACNEQPVIPTLAPTVAAPTQLPPTSTPEPTPTNPQPSPTQIHTPTAEPTSTPVLPSLEETPSAYNGVNITSPKQYADILQGEEIAVGGLVQLGASDYLSVTLESLNGQQLAVGEATVHQFGNWEGALVVPFSVSGTARITASVIDGSGTIQAEDVQEVNLVADTENSERYLVLYRPQTGDTVVAGFNMFFDGWAQLPVNNVLTISLWTEGCQVQIGRQGFVLRGSGYWQGFLIIPQNTSGAACAVAHFGDPDDERRREVQIAVNVLAEDDENAKGIVIGNPPPESVVQPGSSLLIYGTAYNALEADISITIRDEEGRTLTEGITPTDIYGYWELSLFIPSETGGLAEIAAAAGDPDDDFFAEDRILVHIGSSP